MIYRADHSGGHFTQVANSVIWDPRISFKAKMIVVVLLSMPDDDFDINRARLAAIGPDGEKAVRSGLRELTDAGYLDHRLIQDEHGRWRTEADLYEETKANQPMAQKRPPVGSQPMAENRPLSSKTTRGPASFRSRRAPKTKKAASTTQPAPQRRKWENGPCVVCGEREVDMAFLGRGVCRPCFEENREIQADLEKRRAQPTAASNGHGPLTDPERLI